MERLVLTLILTVSILALVRIVWRSIETAHRASSPACQGCPLAGECGAASRSRFKERANGADDVR